jgi:Lar family restriction alleviation protein
MNRCPFCGSRKIVVIGKVKSIFRAIFAWLFKRESQLNVACMCYGCDSRGPWMTSGSSADAIAAWNKRAGD